MLTLLLKYTLIIHPCFASGLTYIFGKHGMLLIKVQNGYRCPVAPGQWQCFRCVKHHWHLVLIKQVTQLMLLFWRPCKNVKGRVGNPTYQLHQKRSGSCQFRTVNMVSAYLLTWTNVSIWELQRKENCIYWAIFFFPYSLSQPWKSMGSCKV